jgi:hypothetical protein
VKTHSKESHEGWALLKIVFLCLLKKAEGENNNLNCQYFFGIGFIAWKVSIFEI